MKKRTGLEINLKVPTKDFDPVGLKATGEATADAIHKVTDATIGAAEKFLRKTCSSLADEVGFFFRDKMAAWRLNNIVRTLEKAEGKLAYDRDSDKLTIHPRVAFQITENASLTDSDVLQEMWAGLFAASCLDDFEEQNILYVEIIKQLTPAQVKIINYICNSCTKVVDFSNLETWGNRGFLRGDLVNLNIEQLADITSSSNYVTIHSAITSLLRIGLITQINSTGAFPFSSFEVSGSIRVVPSFLALQLYIRGQGSAKSPFKFFEPELQTYIFKKIGKYIGCKESEVLSHISRINEELKNFKISVSKNSFDISKVPAEADLNQLLNECLNLNYENDQSATYEVVKNLAVIGSFNRQKGFRYLKMDDIFSG